MHSWSGLLHFSCPWRRTPSWSECGGERDRHGFSRRSCSQAHSSSCCCSTFGPLHGSVPEALLRAGTRVVSRHRVPDGEHRHRDGQPDAVAGPVLHAHKPHGVTDEQLAAFIAAHPFRDSRLQGLISEQARRPARGAPGQPSGKSRLASLAGRIPATHSPRSRHWVGMQQALLLFAAGSALLVNVVAQV